MVCQPRLPNFFPLSGTSNLLSPAKLGSAATRAGVAERRSCGRAAGIQGHSGLGAERPVRERRRLQDQPAPAGFHRPRLGPAIGRSRWRTASFRHTRKHLPSARTEGSASTFAGCGRRPWCSGAAFHWHLERLHRIGRLLRRALGFTPSASYGACTRRLEPPHLQYSQSPKLSPAAISRRRTK